MNAFCFSRKSIVLSLVMVLTSIWLPVPVSACSMVSVSWNEWLPILLSQVDVVVVGQYDTLDGANANGVFRVQSYLKGSGAEYLVINTLEAASVENKMKVERFYYSCGGGSAILKPSGTYIYFLNARDTGMYRVYDSQYFATSDAKVDVSQYRTESIEFTRAEISEQISDLVGAAPRNPDTDAPYPRTTPILLMTESSENFMLPVDRTKLVQVADDELLDLRKDQHECSTSPCAAYSPNGLDKVYLQPEGSEPLSVNELLRYVESNAFGSRLVFSPTSDTYALWTDDQIQLYAVWYPKLGYPDQKYGGLYTPVLFNTTAAGDSIQYPAAWSPDGRTMAFSTVEGLWLWDALTVDYPPQLLLPTKDEVPVARYFSPRGRYLAIEDNGRRYTLDLVTRRELPDGYVSPNDRILLVFNTAATEPTTLEVMYLAPDQRQSEYYPSVKYLKVQWIDDARFRASITGDSSRKVKSGEPYTTESGETFVDAIYYVVNEPFYDTVQYDALGISSTQGQGVVPYEIRNVQVRDFTYENGPGLIEISVDGYSIYVNGVRVSLETELSAPIQEAVWLPSPFYYEDRYPAP